MVAVVIEELTATMDPELVDDYLAADARVWTPYLESCDGFLGKETWVSTDRPGVIVFVIRWATREQWKRITAEEVAAVDARMGVPLPDQLECREYRVA